MYGKSSAVEAALLEDWIVLARKSGSAHPPEALPR
jgi:hypothetical protein